jgi:hypothetical protein
MAARNYVRLQAYLAIVEAMRLDSPLQELKIQGIPAIVSTPTFALAPIIKASLNDDLSGPYGLRLTVRANLAERRVNGLVFPVNF